jgi:hypothetical protein
VAAVDAKRPRHAAGVVADFVFTFNNGERVYVTITSPDNDNANLFVNMMRWLSPKIAVP